MNTDRGVELTQSEDEDRIYTPAGALRIDGTGEGVDRTTNLVSRDNQIYDKNQRKFCTGTVKVDITWDIAYSKLPLVFQRYITARASTRAAVELVNNADLYKMLGQNEVALRAALMDNECTSGDYTYFGSPEGTVYRPYSHIEH